jgi:membrane protein implicated in regulation of membrane protease activity
MILSLFWVCSCLVREIVLWAAREEPPQLPAERLAILVAVSFKVLIQFALITVLALAGTALVGVLLGDLALHNRMLMWAVFIVACVVAQAAVRAWFRRRRHPNDWRTGSRSTPYSDG